MNGGGKLLQRSSAVERFATKGSNLNLDESRIDFRSEPEFKEFAAYILSRMPKKKLVTTREIKERIPAKSPHLEKIRWMMDALESLEGNRLVVHHRGSVIDKFQKI